MILADKIYRGKKKEWMITPLFSCVMVVPSNNRYFPSANGLSISVRSYPHSVTERLIGSVLALSVTGISPGK